MVRDSLTTRIKQLRVLLDRHPSVLALGCCGLVVSMGGAVWISTQSGASLQIQRKPSLLELLDEVASSTPKQVKDSASKQAPTPPKTIGWRSPLAKQCSGHDEALRRRLLSQRGALQRQRQTIDIDASNFGKRYRIDPWKKTIDPKPRVVVLHETSNSLSSAINTFKTHHADDNDQVSYHTLIGRDGRIVDVVNPLYRAFGAGYSAFLGEWAVTNPNFMGSVNNFALHLSLETPEDGYSGGRHHSGYTQAQYDALAVVLDAWMHSFSIPAAAITTHEHVDLGGERGDPRSFDWNQLQVRLAALKRLC